MAQHNLSNFILGRKIIDKRQTLTGSLSPLSVLAKAVDDNLTLDQVLAANNATYWTQLRLDRTCQTDKIKAVLDFNDAAGRS